MRLSRHPEPPDQALTGSSVDRTVQDNKVSALFCATLEPQKGMSHLYKQEREYPAMVRDG